MTDHAATPSATSAFTSRELMDAALRQEAEVDLTGIDYDAILREADEVAAESARLSRNELAHRHASFLTAYPALFAKCLEPGYDREHLARAVGLLKRVQSGAMRKLDADVAFGRATMDCRPQR